MSFEAWCGMTCFDNTQPDGGKPFQNLMLMLLGHGTEYNLHEPWTGADDQMDFTSMYDAQTRTYGKMFKTPDEERKLGGHEGVKDPIWWEGIQQDGNMLGIPTDRGFESTGAHLSVHARPQIGFKGDSYKGRGELAAENKSMTMGLILGNFSNKDNAAIRGTGAKYATKANHYGLYTKHDWIVKSMLSTGTQGRGASQTLGQGLVSPGIDKVSKLNQSGVDDCWEVTAVDKPCMLVQNSLAAIYGLYYYPGCNDELYNWEVQEKVPESGETFTIRFRCPNPMYGPPEWWKNDRGEALEQGRLYVYEPLNPTNQAFLDRYINKEIKKYNREDPNNQKKMKLRQPHTYVGGPQGIEFTTATGQAKAKEETSQQIHKFEVPRTSRDIDDGFRKKGHKEVSPWMWLLNANDTMQVAPFWAQNDKWHKLIANRYRDMDRGRLMRQHKIPVAGNKADYTKSTQYTYNTPSGEPKVVKLDNTVKDGDLVFGFRMSQAYLLYPYRRPDRNDLITRHSKSSTSNRVVGYMTEPKKGGKLVVDAPKPLAAYLTDWLIWKAEGEKDDNWWRKTLLADKTLPVGRPAPNSGKQPVAPRPPPPAPSARRSAASTSSGPTVAPVLAPADGSAVNPMTVDIEQERVDQTIAPEFDDDDLEQEDRVERQDRGATSSNQDMETQQSIAADRTANVNTVATTFGIPGMSLAETLRECNPDYQFEITEIRRFQAKDTEDDSKLRPRELELKKALKACGLYEGALAEGATRRQKDGVDVELQCHWATARHSPWRHEDCYEPARLKYVTETIMTDAQRQEYIARYGHDANLIQQSGNNLEKITGVDVEWGAKKPVLNTKLCCTSDRLHMLNFARILCIYFDPNGVGSFTAANKRKGMLNGLQMQVGSEQGAPQKVTHMNAQGRLTSRSVEVFGPVFANKPENILSRELQNCLKDYLCDRTDTDDTELAKCLDKHPNWEEDLRRIGSEMTVATWVTTPWHLEHLPYQRQYAVFRDGECFSEGCKRCSRTFYEYAYHVYAPISGTKGTFGYPQDMWYRHDLRLAPVPLHDPTFWANARRDGKHYWGDAESGEPTGALEGGTTRARSTARVGAPKPLRPAVEGELRGVVGVGAEVERENIAREYDFYTGGQMAWPMYALQRERVFHKDKERAAMLGRGRPPYFRRYFNTAYSSGKTNGELEDAKQTYYKGITQGYMFTGNHKIKFGHKDFRVTRSHKYGNVCRDCAGILDRAPALLVRNNRWQFSGGLVAGNSEAVSSSNTDYWMNIQNEIFENSDSDAGLDAFLMKRKQEDHGMRLSEMSREKRTAYVAAFDNAAKALVEGFNARFKLPDNWTKLIEQPTIHIQGSIKPQKGRKPEEIHDAIKTLRELLRPGVDTTQLDLQNPALRDLVREAERKYMHNEAYAQIEYTKQFDSDVKRTEYRNCVIRYGPQGLEWLNPPGFTGSFQYDKKEATRRGSILPLNGKTFGKLTRDRYFPAPQSTEVYYNCLITDQYDPELLDSRPIPDTFLRAQRKEHYRVEVYLATRIGPQGKATHPGNKPTQWKGDGFVCQQPGADAEIWKVSAAFVPGDLEKSDGVAVQQQRALRQSRLFITYSLHRPVTDERSGRVILEKMADALYTLFGQDRWLSQMVVMGKMLKSMDVKRARGDNVSKAMWGIIDRTNKSEAMDKFYGSRNARDPRTSYVYDTYETHVDKIEIDAGCEIGPKMGHPHFHCLLTINHFGYVQFDYYKMNSFLEIMFRGIETFHGWGTKFLLPDNFYGDNENPYVDIRLYPQDNWREILAAYVRKNAIPSIVEVESSRRLPGTAEQRRRAFMGEVN
tara:strand:- start:1266 stop:6704 length:5439 start_codon:yes stop_codon:yes gene_type:complete